MSLLPSFCIWIIPERKLSELFFVVQISTSVGRQVEQIGLGLRMTLRCQWNKFLFSFISFLESATSVAIYVFLGNTKSLLCFIFNLDKEAVFANLPQKCWWMYYLSSRKVVAKVTIPTFRYCFYMFYII